MHDQLGDAAMSNIELIDLTKHYRQGKNLVRALDGVSLQIQSGEFVSVVGRSGSGKTTLLDLLGLLLRPTDGTVQVDGMDTARLRDGKRADLRGRRIGFIFQEYNLLPSLNVVQNVMLPLRYARSSVKDGRGRAMQLLDLVGLSDRVRHRPNQLSGGEQQRVAIARALVNRPALVLGDEPTGAVDTQTSEALLALMRLLNREEGVTFVIVTHDLELAAQTDRMIRLRDGCVIGDHAVDRPPSPALAS
jgi:putative ABC transport system ATP-binding protein